MSATEATLSTSSKSKPPKLFVILINRGCLLHRACCSINSRRQKFDFFYAQPLIGGDINRCFCLTSDVCLSVCLPDVSKTRLLCPRPLGRRH